MFNELEIFSTQDQYDSNWEWTKERSNYHFDWSRRDQPGEWFTLLGRFEGEWSDELARAVELSKSINWETRAFYGDTFPVSPMIRQEEQDLIDAGADPKLELTNIIQDFDEFPTLKKMLDYYQLENTKERLHVQLTGQMFNLHIDKLWYWCPDDSTRTVRINVMLEDWVPGQFYQYGTYTYSHWKAGDIHIFDWPNVPHATANASNQPRSVLQITGNKTAFTEEFLARATKDSVYKI